MIMHVRKYPVARCLGGYSPFTDHEMARRLTASQTGFYKELVAGLPMGMAVIHLADPKDEKTWKLVASNASAEHLGGTSAADFLALACRG